MVFQPGCDQAASTSPIASTQPSFSLTETGTQLVLTSRETNCVPVSVPHLSRRLRRFRYLHRHSDSYRLERPRGKQSWRTPRFVVLAMGCSPIRYTMCTSSSLISTRLFSVLIISRRAAQSAESNPCLT